MNPATSPMTFPPSIMEFLQYIDQFSAFSSSLQSPANHSSTTHLHRPSTIEACDHSNSIVNSSPFVAASNLRGSGPQAAANPYFGYSFDSSSSAHLQPLQPSDLTQLTIMSLPQDYDDPTRINNPSNPYSIQKSPGKLTFIMPAFAQGPHQLSLDGPVYAESIDSSFSNNININNNDNNTHSNPNLNGTNQQQQYLAPDTHPTTADQPSPNHHKSSSYPFWSNDFPFFVDRLDSNPPCNTTTGMSTPSLTLSNSSSTLTPPTTSVSRQTSEPNNDSQVSPASPKFPTASSQSPPAQPKYGFSQHFKPPKNPYSPSGFNLMGALARVANRSDPKVEIGPVDSSAAVVVVDAKEPDLPIIFASASFTSLTGYENSEVIGQNCRFLQKPFNSSPVKNSSDKSTECPATLQIRSHLRARAEIQSAIINYRKDGQPFINLVTIVPIAWDGPEIRYFVGFQADIVSLTNKLGIPASPKNQFLTSPAVNSNSDLFKAVTATLSGQKSPKTSPQVAKAPARSASPSSPSTQSRFESNDLVSMPCHYQTILNESRDLILAISLKGTLFYASPSCKNILGYEEEEVVNQNISKFCHPGDLTGILRQLKLIGNTPHTPIDLVFRAVDRTGGILWMESQGQLHVEVGKGRKYLVVVGRPREIGPLPWQAIRSAGGFGENEFWMKLSLDGLCLFATSPVRDILSFEPSEMIGKSLIQLSSAEERARIIDAIKSAYEGNDVITLAYSLNDKHGTPIKLVGDFYPPHYSGGPQACGMPLPSSKLTNPPRFIFCQTNLLSTATRRSKKLCFAKEFMTIPSLLKDPDGTGATRQHGTQILASHTSPQNISGDPASMTTNSSADCDLFSRLATTQTTPWNYEFSQLKRQNLKLHSKISQRGLTRHLPPSKASKNTLLTKTKSTRTSPSTPYDYRPVHRSAPTQEVPESAVEQSSSVVGQNPSTTLFLDENFLPSYNQPSCPSNTINGMQPPHQPAPF